MNYRKFFILLNLMTSLLLFSEVNFNYEFGIPMTTSNDSLVDIIPVEDNQAVIAAFSNFTNNNYKIVKYDSEGNLISSFEENYLENEKLSHIYSSYEDNVHYLYLGFVNELVNEDTTVIKLSKISLSNYSQVDSIIYIYDFSAPPSGLNIQIDVEISDLLIKEINDERFLYLGTVIDYHSDNGAGFGYEETDHKYSELITYQQIGNNFQFVEKLASNGHFVSSSDLLISTGIDKYHYLYNEPPIMESEDSYHSYLYIKSESYLPDNQVFSKFVDDTTIPPYIQILSNEDSSYLNYGTLVYYNDDTIPTFINFSSDFSTILWESNYTTFDYLSQLTTFTNIETNLGDHFSLCFFDDQIEIRDRINGNIVHSESIDITPFSNITLNNQKLFIDHNQNNLDLYSIDGLIQLSCDDNLIPESKYRISNYPNPFNPSTTINFSIKSSSKIDLSIYNTKGQKVVTLAQKNYEPGFHSIVWNGEDSENNSVSSGIYYYKLAIQDKTKAVKKCLLLK